MGCGGTGGAIPGLLPLDTEHPDADEIFRSGDIEDDYDVEKEPIARGKFASVRLARHRSSGELFAAKYVRRRRRAANLEGEARHEVAVLLLGRAAPHIVHLHQVYETRSEYIIILEFGAGGDLQRLLDDQGRLQEKTVRDLLRQVLKGLGFLHNQYVAHLDIKPQNLVLMGTSTEDGVKLVDFGLSRVIHKDAELTQIMGTPDYVAPEVINFESVGLATDMWSIGVLTYVLLTGYTPFGGDSDQETFVNITQGEFDFPDEYFGDVSECAKEFISSLLIKSPKERMTVEQCISHPWLCDLFDPHRLSQLSEADSADSGYSTDLCSGSPPSPGSLANGYVSDLCHFSIPEEQQIPTRQELHPYKQFRPHQLLHLGEEEIINDNERIHHMSGGRTSYNMLDCLQDNRSQGRPLRRSSLVIPRYANGCEREPSVRRNSHVNGCEYEPRASSSLYPSNYYDAGDTSRLNSWNSLSQIGSTRSTNNKYDQNTLLNFTRPWKNLCNGSYHRALNQLSTKSSPKKANSRSPRSNLGISPELSCSMFELKPTYENNNTLHPDLRLSKSDLRKSKAELRSSKSDLRSQLLDLNGARPERVSKPELMVSRSDLKGSNIDLRGSKSDIRASKSDLRGSKSDLRASRNDLRGSKLDLKSLRSELLISNKDLRSSRQSLIDSLNPNTIAHLNMSLSRLDLAHETLNNEESEERDVVYADCTLPRRFSRSNISPLLQGNSFHMSFRRSKKRDGKI